MADMKLMPTADGLKMLKEHTKDGLQKAILLDANKKTIREFEIRASYYDSNGVLTAEFNIPSEDNITTPAHYLYIVANNKTIATGQLPAPISFIRGFGGIQTLKLPIEGQSGEIVFKKDNYLTKTEAVETLLMPMHIQTLELYYQIIEDKLEQNRRENEQENEIKKLQEFAISIKEDMQKQKQNIIESVMAEILEDRYQITELKLK